MLKLDEIIHICNINLYYLNLSTIFVIIIVPITPASNPIDVNSDILKSE